jgi:hypothetical protein
MVFIVSAVTNYPFGKDAMSLNIVWHRLHLLRLQGGTQEHISRHTFKKLTDRRIIAAAVRGSRPMVVFLDSWLQVGAMAKRFGMPLEKVAGVFKGSTIS